MMAKGVRPAFLRGSASRTLGVLLALGLLAGCSEPPPAVAERSNDIPLPQDVLVVDGDGRTGGTLRFPMAGEPGSFNFANVGEYRTYLVSYLLTGTLLEFDRKKQQVSAGVCREWEVAKDGSSVTLKLRRGLRFSDGEPVTTDDVLSTLEKIYQEGSNNILRNSLLVEGRPLKAVKIDDATFRVEFPQPFAAAEFILTLVPVFPRHKISPDKLLEDHWGLDTPPESFVGLGPFVLAEHQPGRRTLFRYNPHYWRIDRKGVRLPYLDALEISYIADRNSQVVRFQGGELDLLDSQLRPDDFLQIKRESTASQVFNAGPSSRLSFLWFNQNTGVDPASGRPYLGPDRRRWFLDPVFRRAVSHAISRESIVRNVFQGMARPAWTPVPASIPAWHAADLPKYDQDPELARKLLKEAGYSFRTEEGRQVLMDSHGVQVAFGLSVRSDDFWGKIAAVLQQDLADIGIELDVQPEEFRSLISRIEGSRDYDAAILSLEFQFDPSDHNLWLSSSPAHFWNPSQKTPATDWERRIDELMGRQIVAFEFTERQRIYHDIQRILFEFMPILPLANQDVLVAANQRVRNVKPANFSPYSLWNVWEIWLDDQAGGR